MQGCEVDAGLELGLDHSGGIEVEHARLITAVRDVQTRRHCHVRHGTRGVEALAVIKHVRAVEVVDAQVVRQGGDGGLHVAFDGVEDVVDDGGFCVGGDGGGAEITAEHRGVEGEHVGGGEVIRGGAGEDAEHGEDEGDEGHEEGEDGGEVGAHFGDCVGGVSLHSRMFK